MSTSLNTYTECLESPCDPEKIVRISKIIFIEGHLDKLDDLIVALLPLAHIVYYKYIKSLDDRGYAKEDLISEAILNLYQDIYLRWDKYIHIDSYYSYFSSVLRNSMIGLVHKYHNYYSQEELDPENIRSEESEKNAYDFVEYRILRESIREDIYNTAKKILRCRPVHTNLLLSIFDCIYVNKSGLDELKSRVRVIGVPSTLFNFYLEHVEYAYRLSYNYHYAIIGGNVRMISRISNTLSTFEDITYKMLAANHYDSIIPEIYAEFGADVAKKFVKSFSGRTVKVPEYQSFCDDLLGGAVLALSDGDKSNLYRLADEYGLSYRTLSRIYDKASKFLD